MAAETLFADPYKKCLQCGSWVDGATSGATLIPCGHRSDYRDVCPSWGPVDGCDCAGYSARHPEDPISHDMRPPADDGKVY